LTLGPWSPTGTTRPPIQSRRDIAERVTELTVNTTTEALRAHCIDLPAWAATHLAHHAARGNYTHDPDELAALYRRIDEYRRQAGIDKSDPSTSTAETLFGAAMEDSALRLGTCQAF
jgi:hypothetical protein